jgi:uncharacterized surface protein with fasciclin (FAS1) repeats
MKISSFIMFSPSYRFKLLATTISLASVSLLAGTPVLAESCSSKAARPTAMSQVKAEAKQQTVVEIAASAGSFNTLTAALKAAGLVEVLEGKGPFTVFAPTDEAFAALPEGTVENLLKPENKDTLVKILTYHVVSGAVMSTDLKAGEVATVEGSPVTIQLGESVTVNDARVVQADIKASNGVIHVIDKVILPAE